MSEKDAYPYILGKPIGHPDKPTRDYTKAETDILKPWLVDNTPGVTNSNQIWKQTDGYLFLATYKALMKDRGLKINMSRAYVDSTAAQIKALIAKALNANDKVSYTPGELNKIAKEIKSKFIQETQPSN